MSDKMILNKIETHASYYKHPSYYLERRMLNALQRCSRTEALATLKAINKLERAILADSPIRSTKNSLIASCTLFTRAAIEANVPPEDAFSHSDVHIREIEHLDVLNELQQYEYVMLEDYLSLVSERITEDYSPITRKMIEYIHENIDEQITLEQLSLHTGRSESYLCKLFRKEVGMSLTDYVNFHKVEETKYFLKYSNMSISKIAFMFNFCNPGYYSMVFRKYAGVSPKSFKLSGSI